MTPKDILVEARSLIADPSHWTQKEFARNGNGSPVDPTSGEATCFCADGALTRAYRSCIDPIAVPDSWGRASALLNRAAHDLAGVGYINLNDGSYVPEGMAAHEAILKAFDMAIERA